MDTKDKELSGADKVKSDALRLLSFRPRSIAELKDRLKLKKHPAELIDETIELLKRQGLLDDAKFAKLYANSVVSSKPMGKKRLELDLVKKGLTPKAAKETLASIEGYDEKKAAYDLVRGRFLRMEGLPVQTKKSRIFGFLQRRGFSSDIIYSVINDLFKNESSQEF